MAEEIWKKIQGHAHYEVSSLRRVRSSHRSPKGQWRLLRPGLISVGYLSVALGRGNTKLVHRLVAEAFFGTCPPGHEVLHTDGSRDNNRVENLRYGTRAENIEDSKAHGTFRIGLIKKSKISPESRNLVKQMYESGKYTKKYLAGLFGVCDATIIKTLRGGHAPLY